MQQIAETFEKFWEDHPTTALCGVETLFKFYTNHKPKYLEDLFAGKKLYHSLPSEFNDPFETKPFYKLPTRRNEKLKLRKSLVKIMMKQHLWPKAWAVHRVSEEMKDKKGLEKCLREVIQGAMGTQRLCCFTTKGKSLLLWAYYADAHQGLCVEFDTKKVAFSLTVKIKYTNEFPKICYPLKDKSTLFILTKSKDWEHEHEFRSILVPGDRPAMPNDGESLLLEGSEIRNVYFGLKMEEKNKQLIFDLLKRGGITPGIFNMRQSENSFNLIADQVN